MGSQFIISVFKKRDKLIQLTWERLYIFRKNNPDIPLEEQVENLSYDFKWEFPPERLILGAF